MYFSYYHGPRSQSSSQVLSPISPGEVDLWLNASTIQVTNATPTLEENDGLTEQGLGPSWHKIALMDQQRVCNSGTCFRWNRFRNLSGFNGNLRPGNVVNNSMVNGI